MKAAAHYALAFIALLSMARADGGPSVPGLDSNVLARGFIPSPNNVHGEVRLIRGEHGACVQTLLYSRQLRRGLFEMKKMERRSWPEGARCHEDSTKYLAAMDQARDTVLGQRATTTNESSVADRLLIELRLDAGSAGYTLYEMELEGPPTALMAVRTRPIVTHTAHPFYVGTAMKLMAENGLKLHGAELEELLTQAGWQQHDPPPLPYSEEPVPR